MNRYLLTGFVLIVAGSSLYAQDTKLPSTDDVKALLAKYQAERETAVKSGVAQRFLPALLDRADSLAKKGLSLIHI